MFTNSWRYNVDMEMEHLFKYHYNNIAPYALRASYGVLGTKGSHPRPYLWICGVRKEK